MQNFNIELTTILKRKAQELGSRKRNKIKFYTDGSLGKGEDKGIIGVRQIGIDRIENSIVSIGNLKVVNWPISTKAELVGI